MPADLKVTPEGSFTLDETGDIATVTDTTNRHQQIALAVQSATDDVVGANLGDRTEQERVRANVAEALRGHRYVNELRSIRVTRSDPTTLSVTVDMVGQTFEVFVNG